MFGQRLNHFQRHLLLDEKKDIDDDGGKGGKGSSGAADDDASGKSTEDKVAYETYQKVLAEKKSIQAKQQELETELSELRKKNQEAEAEKVKASGDKDAYIKTLETNLQTQKTQFETDQNKFKMAKVVSTFREVAAKEGCQYVEDLQKLYADSFKEVKVNPLNFDVDQDSIKEIISKAKEKSAHLFTKKDLKITDLYLKDGGNNDSYKEELKKCKTQKEFDALRKKYNRA